MPVKSRIRWGLACGIGFIISLLLGIVVWWAIGPLYTAKAYFLISQEKPTILSPSKRLSQYEFEILKNTQKELLVSPAVLRPVLRDNAEINQLAVIKKQRDPLQWLSKKLSVSYPGQAEYMEVGISLPDPMDAVKIVSAVVDSYCHEVVDKQRRERQKRLDDLGRVYNEAASTIRMLRAKLRNMSDRFSRASNPETYALLQRLTLDQYAASRSQLMQSDIQVSQLYMDLASQRALREAVEQREPTEQECLNYGRNDQRLRRLAEELAKQDLEGDNIQKEKAPGAENEKMRKSVAVKERAQHKYNERLGQLKDDIKNKKLADIDIEIRKLEASLKQAKDRQNRLAKETDQLREQAEQLGSSSIEVEMYWRDLKDQELNLQNISLERQRLAADQEAPSQISLIEKPTTHNPSDSPNNIFSRLLITFLSMAGSFILCVVVVFLWNVQKRRRLAFLEPDSSEGR